MYLYVCFNSILERNIPRDSVQSADVTSISSRDCWLVKTDQWEKI